MLVEICYFTNKHFWETKYLSSFTKTTVNISAQRKNIQENNDSNAELLECFLCLQDWEVFI